MQRHLANQRNSYEQGQLDEADATAQPLALFLRWLADAEKSKNVTESNAMTLATVGADGRPSTRVVLIKDADERGLVWYTNYDSRKAQELAVHPQAALQFHWVELERVVRIEALVEKVSAEESDAYFAVRPLDSRIGAWASPQSQVGTQIPAARPHPLPAQRWPLDHRTPGSVGAIERCRRWDGGDCDGSIEA